MIGFDGLICDASGKFSNTEKPEGPNGLRHLASHIYELLMPNGAGEKAGADQAGVVEWYANPNPYHSTTPA